MIKLHTLRPCEFSNRVRLLGIKFVNMAILTFILNKGGKYCLLLRCFMENIDTQTIETESPQKMMGCSSPPSFGANLRLPTQVHGDNLYGWTIHSLCLCLSLSLCQSLSLSLFCMLLTSIILFPSVFLSLYLFLSVTLSLSLSFSLCLPLSL